MITFVEFRAKSYSYLIDDCSKNKESKKKKKKNLNLRIIKSV